jgi:flavin-dependent dehydrogenase
MKALRNDVLVIGGGPAGATAAFQLSDWGIGVTLIDRARFPRDKACGESLSPGAIARLASLGMWHAPPGPESTGNGVPGKLIRGMSIRSPRGTTFRGLYTAGSAGLAIRRTVLDRALLESARRRGATVMEGLEALRAETGPDGGAVVHARDTGGLAPIRVEARHVIVADGRRSFVARQLGFLEPELRGAGRRYAVRAHVDGVSDLSDFAEMQVGRGGYCGVAPLSKASANICYVLFDGGVDMKPHAMAADFRRHVSGFPDVAKRIEGARIEPDIQVVGPLRLRSNRQISGPFIACGDTTGFLDPFTGEGIAHAIASGALGAAAVRASLEGSIGSFAEYEGRVRRLRRIKGAAARFLYGLVSRPALADSAAAFFSRLPRLGNSVVRLFGDQV